MASTYAVQHATRALARNLRRGRLLWLLGAGGVCVQLFYFAIGPLGRGHEPLPLRYPAADVTGFAVGPHGEAALASSFYGHLQVYDESGRFRALLPLRLSSDGSPLAFDAEGNLYACTEEGVRVFDKEMRPTSLAKYDERHTDGLWKVSSPGQVQFFPQACPSREVLRAARAPVPTGGALFLMEEKADRRVARPVGNTRRCVTADGVEATWSPWLARVDFHAADGSGWSAGTPWLLLPFTLIWPGVLWWGVVGGLCWGLVSRRARPVDAREERRRQLV